MDATYLPIDSGNLISGFRANTSRDPDVNRPKAGNIVSQCASLASLLEVSAYPKPGNVHRTRDFPETKYEHFLAGSVAIAPALRCLALRGFDVAEGKIGWKDVEIGRYALEAVTNSLNWQSGGNVNLGITLLFSPLAVASGATLRDKGTINSKELQKRLKEVLRGTTTDDVIYIYEAIRISMTQKTLGKTEELDVRDDASLVRIRNEGLTLLEIFQRCAGRDSICDEWVSDFKTIFEVGFSYLKEALKRYGDVNYSIVETFLHILSSKPDSLIVRKAGHNKAVEVSDKAGLILDNWRLESEQNLEMVWELDRELQYAGGSLNPGTTADLTAASIFVALLEGWRP